MFNFLCFQREVLSAVKNAVVKLVLSSMPVTAQRTAWPKETAALTTGLSAKVGGFQRVSANWKHKKMTYLISM